MENSGYEERLEKLGFAPSEPKRQRGDLIDYF